MTGETRDAQLRLFKMSVLKQAKLREVALLPFTPGGLPPMRVEMVAHESACAGTPAR